MTLQIYLQQFMNLQLPQDHCVIVGSAAMAIRGIREAKDLDVIVTPNLWNTLNKKYSITKNSWGIERIEFGDIEILNPLQSIFGNSKIIPREELFAQAEVFDGILFMHLEHLKKIKAYLGRDLDFSDITLIEKYLGNI
jgi:hypothetical protein